ncbi:MAG: zinc-dependent metalloprotease [Chitinophagaceae bacterium]|nr:zinc-dependent metalloprotease [Chitinophagaceae bacterium]
MQESSRDSRQKLLSNEQKISSFIQSRKALRKDQRKKNNIAYIPVVVHVLHTGGTIGSRYNPSDEQISDAISYLNEIYSGTHPSLTPAGTNAAGDIGIRFIMAQRDPDCNPTNGINRIDMSDNESYVSDGVSSNDYTADVAFKTPIAWDQKRYYNIYVVNKINGQDGTSGQFIAGYAYFPTDDIVDGTVMLATQMKAGSKTLPHEIGHAFNLYHPFEGSTSRTRCPMGPGDRVDDTDPISYNATPAGVVNFACRTGKNTCNGGALFNIRTESNFMNYTNCYTLFTPGQKERMQASLELDERKSLTVSTALLRTDQAPACIPKINFEQHTAVINAVRERKAGCRAFKDYLFKLTIGSAPGTNTTATINISPATTALEGVDFDFPSGKEIVFPSGTTGNKTFVIRIYDNGSSEPEKKMTLDLSINNNGGNAVRGSAIPQMNILLKTINHSPVAPGSEGIAMVGENSFVINDAKTFDASIARQKTQILYRADELKAAGVQAGLIKSIGFFLEKHSTRPYKNLHIKMKQVTIAALVQDGNINAAGNLTEVLSLPAYETVDGWNDFPLQTAFSWNGIDNVAIELCFDNETYQDDDVDIIGAYSDGSADTDANMIVEENVDCAAGYTNITFYQEGIKPATRLNYALTGNAVRSSNVDSRSEYLGPYSEIYFYDNASPARILGKIKNLSDWNYGCTAIKIDRSGNSATAFWNKIPSQYLTRKTFFVKPEFNNPEGSFEITLYYTSTEKNGYEAATGNNWNHIKIIKTKVPVSDITPQNPQSDQVEINPEVEHTTYGAGYTLKSRFSTGMSGFSAGIINTALPVTWIDFKAALKNEDIQLSWTTAMEMNNSHFEVEVSTDGIDFAWLATVPSKGNSNMPAEYAYLHKQPPYKKLFYRLKQVDNDAVFSYSKTISIVTGNDVKTPYLYPVPSQDNITIHFGQPVLNAAIELFSSDMKLLYSEKTKAVLLTRKLNIAGFPAGTYFIRITAANRNDVMRFIKY